MISGSKTEAGDGEPTEVESRVDGLRGISAVFLSKPIIEALDVGNISWAIRHVAFVERQLESQGQQLDFSLCQGVVSEIRSAYPRCLENGLKTQAQALERVFEKYFSMGETAIDE